MSDYSVGGVLVDTAEEAARVIIGDWLYAGGKNCHKDVADSDALDCVLDLVDDDGTLVMHRVGTDEYALIELSHAQLKDIAQSIIDDASRALDEAEREAEQEYRRHLGA